MPTSTFYPSADGPVRYYDGSGTWASIRGAATGTDAYPTANPSSVVYNDASLPLILRGFWAFDTSALADDAVIVAATLKLYGSAAATGSADSVHIVQGSQGSPVAVADFDAVGSTSFGSIALSSWSGSGYNSIALNSSGIAAINRTGTTLLAARGSSDLDNSAPGSQQSCAAYYSEETGTSKDPILEVVYATPRTTSDSWAWSDAASYTGSDYTLGGLTTRARHAADAWAWSDSVAPYWRAQRTPVLVRAEGANTQLNGAQTMSSGTITVDSTTGFPSSGTLYCHDAADASKQTAVTYTGKTGTTFTGCTGGAGVSYSDNSPVGAADAESHFPSVNALDDTAAPRILVSYHQHFAHAGGGGGLKGKVSTDGGLSWGSEQTIQSAAVAGGWAGIYGHTALRCADGTLYVAWYEQDLTNRVWFKSYSVRGTPDGSGWFTFDTPVQVTSPFHADSCGVGFHAFEDGGYLYQPVYGTDNSPYITYVGDTYVKLLRSSDKGATWTTRGTIATEAQLGGIEGSESCIVRLASGRWIAMIRNETTNRSRLLCYSDDQGATWTGHDDVIIDYHGNDPSMHLMPEGHVIVQGQELRGGGGGVYGSTVTYVSTDSGTTWPSTLWRQEENDATYSIGNGSGFFTISDTSISARRVLNAYAQERASQGGAQVKFQWYALPNFPLAYDTWAWSDSAAGRISSQSKTTSDAWAWSDVAVGALSAYYSRTTSDAWTWLDSATGTFGTPIARTTSDAWAWSDAAADTYAGPHYYSRTTADTWSWSDSTGNAGTALYWLRAARRRSMSAPTKTYTSVQAKGTTRTATWTSPTYKSETEAGILVVLDVTAASGTGGLTLRVNAHDLAGSVAVPLNVAPTAVTATGTTSYAVYPFGAISGALTQSTSGYLPRQFSITVTHGDSSSYTYSVGYCLLP